MRRRSGAHGWQTVTLVAWVIAVTSASALLCSSDPCMYGICVDDDTNSSYSCYCIDGYTGINCEINWDDCWSNPCLNGGTCNDAIAAYNCTCTEGFVGINCEEKFDECLRQPCLNNGTCVNDNGFLCQCPEGFSGEFCEIDASVCNSTICKHSGECVEGPGFSFYCRCSEGWTGRTCEEDVDECLDSPCQNGGFCMNVPSSYACACLFGYTGKDCDREIIRCDENPCRNGAVCLLEDDQPVCYCVPDFHGQLCELRYDDCESKFARCANGGSCVDGINSYTCACPPEYYGETCLEFNATASPSPSPSPEPMSVPSLVSETTPTFPPPIIIGSSSAPTVASTESTSTSTSRTPEVPPTSHPTFSEAPPTPHPMSEATPISTRISETTISPHPSTPSFSEAPPLILETPPSFPRFTETPPTVSPPSLETTPSSPRISEIPSTSPPPIPLTPPSLPRISETTPTSPPSISETPPSIIKISEAPASLPRISEAPPTSPRPTSEGPPSFSRLFEATPTSTVTSPVTEGWKGEGTKVEGESLTHVQMEGTTRATLADAEGTATPKVEFTPETTIVAGGAETRDGHMTPVTLETTIAEGTIGIREMELRTTDATWQSDSNVDEVTVIDEIKTPTPMTSTGEGGGEKGVISATEGTKATSEKGKEEGEGQTTMVEVSTVNLAKEGEVERGETTTMKMTTAKSETSGVEDCSKCNVTMCPNVTKCDCTGREPCVSPSIREAAFNGKSYIRQRCEIVDEDDVGGRIGGGVLRIRVKLRTKSRNGVILHVFFDDDRYMLLYMDYGQLKFQFSCGLQTMLLGEIDTALDNGDEVEIETRFQHQPATREPAAAGRCSASLYLNGSMAMSGEQKLSSAIEEMPKEARLHVGGVPLAFSHYSTRVTVGFVGCMSVLQVNGRRRDFLRDSLEAFQVEECASFLCLWNPCRNFGSCVEDRVSGRVGCRCVGGWTGDFCERSVCETSPCHLGSTCVSSPGTGFLCVCPFGLHGLFCEKADDAVDFPSFSVLTPGFASYAAYGVPELDLGRRLQLRLRILPHSHEQISLVAYMGQGNSPHQLRSHDHFALTYVRGYVMLTWDLGSGVRRIFTTTPLTALRAYVVTVGRNGRDSWLQVEGLANVTGRSSGSMTHLDVAPVLYIGGHKSRNFEDLPHDLPLHTGFSGCIYDVEFRVGDRVVPVTKNGRATGRGVGECYRNECVRHSCKNGAVCLSRGPTYSCVCTREWEGPDCSVPVNCNETLSSC